jgi:hypothetical protein
MTRDADQTTLDGGYWKTATGRRISKAAAAVRDPNNRASPEIQQLNFNNRFGPLDGDASDDNDYDDDKSSSEDSSGLTSEPGENFNTEIETFNAEASHFIASMHS